MVSVTPKPADDVMLLAAWHLQFAPEGVTLELVFPPQSSKKNDELKKALRQQLANLKVSGRMSPVIIADQLTLTLNEPRQIALLLPHAGPHAVISTLVESGLCRQMDGDLFGEEKNFAVTDAFETRLKDCAISSDIARRMRPMNERDAAQHKYIEAIRRRCTYPRATYLPTGHSL